MGSISNNKDIVKGIFHLHSRYSHDGKDSLKKIAEMLGSQGFSFCILADHFEDFTPELLMAYFSDIRIQNEQNRCILIPGIEKKIEDAHIILFPVDRNINLNSLSQLSNLSEVDLVKVFAHPTKHRPSRAQEIINRYSLDFVEIWNQQVDGSRYPNIEWLKEISVKIPVLFGTDIHDMRHQIFNTIAIENNCNNVIDELIAGKYILRNDRLCLETTSAYNDFLTAINHAAGRRDIHFIANKFLRFILKSLYNHVPLKKSVLMNTLKNNIRSKL